MNFSIGDPIFSEAMACVFPIWQTEPQPEQRENAIEKTETEIPAPLSEKIRHTWNGLRIFFPAVLLAVYLLLRYFIAWSPMHKPSFRFLECGFFTGGLFTAIVLAGPSSGKTVLLILAGLALAALLLWLLLGTKKSGFLPGCLAVVIGIFLIVQNHGSTLREFFPLLILAAALFLYADLRQYQNVMENAPANAVRLLFAVLTGISCGIVYVTLVPDWSSRVWWYWCGVLLPFLLIAFPPRWSHLKKN